MYNFGNEISTAEVSGDSAYSSEIKSKNEVSESEMDEDLLKELDDSYELRSGKGNYKSDSGFNEIDEIDEDEAEEDGTQSDDLKTAIDSKYNSYIEGNGFAEDSKHLLDNSEGQINQLKCRNEELEGQEHPETGVPFVKRQVEIEGEQYEVVVPEFESLYDARLPEDLYEASDHVQFKECTAQLKEEVKSNKELREMFDEEQLEQIDNGDVPSGYTWHHDADAGKMQLVDTEAHQKTGHTGGRFIWGGGTDNR